MGFIRKFIKKILYEIIKDEINQELKSITERTDRLLNISTDTRKRVFDIEKTIGIRKDCEDDNKPYHVIDMIKEVNKKLKEIEDKKPTTTIDYEEVQHNDCESDALKEKLELIRNHNITRDEIIKVSLFLSELARDKELFIITGQQENNTKGKDSPLSKVKLV